MGEVPWWAGSIAFWIAGWAVCNWWYGRIWGRRVKWRWAWMTPGALIWAQRLITLEQERDHD